jgi:D-alanyl-D-alanine carboxypeptidase
MGAQVWALVWVEELTFIASQVFGVSPPKFRDDIPLARRSRAPVPRRPPLWLTLLRGALLLGLAIAGLIVLRQGGMLPWLEPGPVAGLRERPSADGRLLGHFPYPEAPSQGLVALGAGLQLRPEAASALIAMQQAAAGDGVDLRVLSAFRSIDLQRSLFFDVKAERNQDAHTRAKVSAPPGYSEHSTGYAVDLGDGGLPETNLSQNFENTATYKWMSRNAGRYHFTLSFPKGNHQGVSYEPWHWRFEGSSEALRLFEPAQRLGPILRQGAR